MKVKVVKAKKALGFRAYIKLMNLKLKQINSRLDFKKSEVSIEDELAVERAERELDLYKKPGFYKNRKIKVVDVVPRKPRSETIYVSFNKTGYEIRSGRNFIHIPIIEYGNLRYACVDLEHPITTEEKDETLKNLVRVNNGKLITRKVI